MFSESGVGLSGGPSQLYQVNPSSTGIDLLVGTIRTSGDMQPVITDIALSPSGTLYGASFNALYLLNKDTAVAELIGSGFGVTAVNALAFDRDGSLFGATNSGQFLLIDMATGVATVVGSFGSGFTSSGDIDLHQTALFLRLSML